MADCEVTLWTSCEAVLEERWTLRTSPEVACALKAGTRSLADVLDDEDIEVVAVENVDVHSEGTRDVRRVEVMNAVAQRGVQAAIIGELHAAEPRRCPEGPAAFA